MAPITTPGVTPWKYCTLTSSTSLFSYRQIKLVYTHAHVDYLFVNFHPLQTNYFISYRILKSISLILYGITRIFSCSVSHLAAILLFFVLNFKLPSFPVWVAQILMAYILPKLGNVLTSPAFLFIEKIFIESL